MLVRVVLVLWLAILWPSISAGDASESGSEDLRFAILSASEADFSIAIAAHRRGELDAARQRYESAIRQDASFVEAMVNLARIHIDWQEFDAAAKWLDRAETKRPTYPDLVVVRGLLALRSGRIADAIENLSRAHADAPRSVEIMTNLGAALLAHGQGSHAIDVLVAAMEQDPNRAATIFNLGLAYDRKGDLPRASHHYARFLQLAPRAAPGREAVGARLEVLKMRLGGSITPPSKDEISTKSDTSLATHTGESSSHGN